MSATADDATTPLRIALVTLGDPERLTGGYLYHRRLAELAPRHGAAIEFVSFPERPFPLARLAAARVNHEVGEFGADAVLLDSIAAAFFTVTAEPPYVPILHQPPGGIDHGPLRTALQARLDAATYRRAGRILVASDALGEEMAARGFPRASLTVAAPGRDVAATSGPPPGDLRRGRAMALLSVGNWVERKGLLELLDAVATLPQDAVTLHLVGAEDAEPAYGERVRARLALPDLADRVVRHGAVDRGVVRAFYEAADVFALASLREPYGTVYGEAMDSGLPVVGWRAGNLPHLARDGVEGLAVAPGDVAALAAALGRLAADPALRRTMGEAARARAAAFPNWDETTRLVVATVRAAVADRAGER